MKKKQDELRRLLKSKGYRHTRSRGSHSIYTSKDGTVSVPLKLNKMIERRLIKELTEGRQKR